MADKNNGGKKKVYGDFIITGTVIVDRISGREIYKIQATSVDNAINELQRVNDNKLRQAGRDLMKQQTEQLKIINKLLKDGF